MSSATPPRDETTGHAQDLCAYIEAAPSPYHVVSETASRLASAGFGEVRLEESWPDDASDGYIRRDGTLIAWRQGAGTDTHPFRIVGAHTDSPGFRVKPRPDVSSAGWRQLGVEVYGGPLLNSWLDRDLGLAGRVVVSHDGGTRVTEIRDDRAVLRIPQLAIHLDREINDNGLRLDRQRHLVPIWGLGRATDGDFARHLASLADCDAERIIGWDVMPFDLAEPRIVGLDREFIASARLDNLVSCHAAVTALIRSSASSHTSVIALFDHEEVGSTSASGAGGALLSQVLERAVGTRGGNRAAFLTALGGSHAVSIDMAHATHPNYPERHEPTHPIVVGSGPALKINSQQRYATDAVSQAPFVEACDAAGVPMQHFVGHSSAPCGSTIGPMTAAGLGVGVVDVGVPQLAMHSVRELCGVHDPYFLTLALHQYFAST